MDSGSFFHTKTITYILQFVPASPLRFYVIYWVKYDFYDYNFHVFEMSFQFYCTLVSPSVFVVIEKKVKV